GAGDWEGLRRGPRWSRANGSRAADGGGVGGKAVRPGGTRRTGNAPERGKRGTRSPCIREVGCLGHSGVRARFSQIHACVKPQKSYNRGGGSARAREPRFRRSEWPILATPEWG